MPLGWLPARQHQFVISMLQELFHVLIAVLFQVYKLSGKLMGRFALENHFHVSRGQMPVWSPRRRMRTCSIFQLVAIGTLHGIKPLTVCSTFWKHFMDMAVIPLQGYIPNGMAVNTSGAHQHCIYFLKSLN